MGACPQRHRLWRPTGAQHAAINAAQRSTSSTPGISRLVFDYALYKTRSTVFSRKAPYGSCFVHVFYLFRLHFRAFRDALEQIDINIALRMCIQHSMHFAGACVGTLAGAPSSVHNTHDFTHVPCNARVQYVTSRIIRTTRGCVKL